MLKINQYINNLLYFNSKIFFLKSDDSSGRLVVEKTKLNNLELSIPINETNQLFLVVITTINGEIITKKVMV